jgi:uncharacterized protein YbcI
MAREIARAAKSFEEQRTGHGPASVTVVLSADVLVITLHDVLSKAEKALARAPGGAAQVQEFHRQLFASAAVTLRREIEEITGVSVVEAAAEVEPSPGMVVHTFGAGTVVQVFLLADTVETSVWSDVRPQAEEERAHE